ncbi:uncharacterized protein ARMOST_16172 [Armillaria ostoyae]|uniref:RING-type domain-containing protein n=1 Tax=Armillaria ostoyae TaxID=47428 RepID=A0A284RVG8_ARMOS|nr:uncharacterized protein ARMOST_16172 [Armillaria ostoyae]
MSPIKATHWRKGKRRHVSTSPGSILVAEEHPSGPTKSSKQRTKAGAHKHSKEVIVISSDEDEELNAATRKNVLELEDALKKSKQETIEAKQAQEKAEIKVASYDEELEAMQADADQPKINASELQDDTTCDICTMIMERPFILPQCGHVSCQACIHEWFDTIRQENWRGPFGRRYRPVYNCPTCRKIVTTEPVKVYKLKSVAQKMGQIFIEDVVHSRTPDQNETPWALFFPRRQ